MGIDLIRESVRQRFQCDERGHACAILTTDFPSEWANLMDCLDAFTLTKTMILTRGGNRGPISKAIDGFLQVESRGWSKKRFDTKILVDDYEKPSPTHEIDNFKNRVGVEVEWNNKDPFYDRDLNNFRLLHQLDILSVGVVITRSTELQREFDRLGKGKSYGPSTTHWGKLIPKVNGGGAGGCPLLLFGIGMNCYDPSR